MNLIEAFVSIFFIVLAILFLLKQIFMYRTEGIIYTSKVVHLN